MEEPARVYGVRPGARNLLIDRRARTLPLLSVDALPPEAPALVRGAVRMANKHRFWPQVKIFLLSFAVMVALSLVVTSFTKFRANPVVYWVLISVLSGRLGRYGGKKMIRVNAENAYTLCLAAGICPSCGYGIRGIPRDAQGDVTCPECAGAWPGKARRPAPLPVTSSAPAPSTAAVHQTPASG